MNKLFSNLSKEEIKTFKSLNNPKKIQDFLNKIPINFEPNGDTCLSPRSVLKQNTCHCIEGAILAYAILKFHNQPCWLIDLKTTSDDFEHVVCLFKHLGFYGAVSKTNHSVLRYREPIYKTPRELVMSYFHEYFKDNGKKTLRSFSKPVTLNKFSSDWLTSEDNLWEIHDYLDEIKHFQILNKKQIKNLRKAEKIEIEAGKITEWKKK